jgi:hypothetical protein
MEKSYDKDKSSDRDKTSPSHVLFVRDAPQAHLPEFSAFENLMKDQPGFVTIRYFGRNAYVEFKETRDATDCLESHNGRKYFDAAPALRLDYDRDAGKPKKRKLDHDRGYSDYGRSRSPPRYGISPYALPRYPALFGSSRDPLPYHSDPYNIHSGHSSHRDHSPRAFPTHRERSPPPRTYYDPYAWMRTFIPYWETTGNVPADPVGRMEMNNKTTKSCNVLFVNRLPPDLSRREIHFLFCWLPNFQTVRMVHKSSEVIAFVEFVDAASAYVAMTIMQGFYISGLGIQIEFDRHVAGEK